MIKLFAAGYVLAKAIYEKPPEDAASVVLEAGPLC
jgi:hypothetical protein|tara:strand:- start:4899 stop:5003 length:105 start_codon:yes stop_codon:yes gene_type:complete